MSDWGERKSPCHHTFLSWQDCSICLRDEINRLRRKIDHDHSLCMTDAMTGEKEAKSPCLHGFFSWQSCPSCMRNEIDMLWRQCGEDGVSMNETDGIVKEEKLK